MIQRLPIDYGNNGLEWRGWRMNILMYDKILRETRKPGNIMRAEIQLSRERLIKELGSGQSVTVLKFNRCYRIFRGLIKKFNSVRTKKYGVMPSKKYSTILVPRISNVIELIAFAEKRRGIDLWPHFAINYKNQQSRNRKLKELRACKLKYFRLDWSKLLPKSGPRWRAEFDATNGKTISILKIRNAV